jgi:hypothetical protein
LGAFCQPIHSTHEYDAVAAEKGWRPSVDRAFTAAHRE